MALITEPNLELPDPFYEALIETHRDLNDAQSQALNARLLLLLANHIGRHDVLLQALAAARSSGRGSDEGDNANDSDSSENPPTSENLTMKQPGLGLD